MPVAPGSEHTSYAVSTTSKNGISACWNVERREVDASFVEYASVEALLAQFGEVDATECNVQEFMEGCWGLDDDAMNIYKMSDGECKEV